MTLKSIISVFSVIDYVLDSYGFSNLDEIERLDIIIQVR